MCAYFSFNRFIFVDGSIERVEAAPRLSDVLPTVLNGWLDERASMGVVCWRGLTLKTTRVRMKKRSFEGDLLGSGFLFLRLTGRRRHRQWNEIRRCLSSDWQWTSPSSIICFIGWHRTSVGIWFILDQRWQGSRWFGFDNGFLLCMTSFILLLMCGTIDRACLIVQWNCLCGGNTVDGISMGVMFECAGDMPFRSGGGCCCRRSFTDRIRERFVE